MINVLLITEVHYSIDVVGGLILSVWAFRTSKRIVEYIDKFISLPFKAGECLIQKYRQKKSKN
jgi:membrane-associated phospholipid phosphatase